MLNLFSRTTNRLSAVQGYTDAISLRAATPSKLISRGNKHQSISPLQSWLRRDHKGVSLSNRQETTVEDIALGQTINTRDIRDIMLKTALQKATTEGVSPSMYDKLRSTLGPLAGQAGELGDADDLKLHRTLDRGFAKRLDKSSERILRLARSMVEAVDKNKNAGSSKAKTPKVRQKLQDEDDVVHEFTPNVQDTVDGLLEATVS